MKKPFYIMCLIILCLSLTSVSVFAAENETYWANRTLMLPGTSYLSMQQSLNGAAILDASYSEGENTFQFTASNSKTLQLYFKTSTADSIEVNVLNATATLMRLSMVPRTYFTYNIYGLISGELYSLKINSKSYGNLLVY